MAKGSLTVFVSLVLVSVMTLLFAMSECIRFVGMDSVAEEYTTMAVESSFSEYNPYLWTNYRILGIDLGYGTDNVGPGIFETKTADYCQENANIEEGYSYLRLNVDTCEATQYGLLTDGNGQAIVNLGVKAAKQDMASQLVDFFQDEISEVNSIEPVSVEDQVQKAKDDMANAEQNNSDSEDDDDDDSQKEKPEKQEMEDNPFDAFTTLQDLNAKGILSQVVPVNKLSEASVVKDNLPSHRAINSGNLGVESENEILDKVLFVDYLMTNYGYYGSDKKHDGLNYEIEYLISGEETDVQNLSSVVEQILLVRVGANLITIYTTDMAEEAAVVAEIVAGWTVNPAIIEAVKIAIIAIWAYSESILDVRQLMTGGKVPLYKTKADWSADLYHLSTIANVNTKAKDSETGLGYKEYLMAFLALRSNTSLGFRAADVMEDALSKTEDYKNVKLDNMMYACETTISFSGNEMFLSLLDSERTEDNYYLTKSKFMIY